MIRKAPTVSLALLALAGLVLCAIGLYGYRGRSPGPHPVTRSDIVEDVMMLEGLAVGGDESAALRLIAECLDLDPFKSSRALASLQFVLAKTDHKNIHRSAHDAIVARLDSSDDVVRREAALAAGELRVSSGDLEAKLRSLVDRYPDHDFGWISARTLGRLPLHDPDKALESLQKARDSGNAQMRREASQAYASVSRRSGKPG